MNLTNNHNSFKLTSVYILGIIFLLSCGQKAKKIEVNDTIKSVSVKRIIVKGQNDTLAIPEDTIPKVTFPEGTIQVAECLVNTSSKVKILKDGNYNGQDNVGPKDAKLSWKGIFYNHENYYIRSVTIKFIKIHSEFDDDDKPDQKTGWLIKHTGKDTILQLISGANDLIIGPITRVKLDDFYYAGQKQEFNYKGVTYTVYATGNKRNGYIYNFKLFLTAKVKGRTFNQQLVSLGNDVALHHGNDAVDNIFIDFAGDIDGDGIPDLLLSDSGYAFGSTSLYLSKPAGDKAILKLVAYFAQSD